MIEVKNITKKYEERIVLNDISFTAGPGTVIGIIGASGSGKSTLLNIMGQLDSQFTGDVVIDGQSTARIKNKKRLLLLRNKIFYLFQNYALVDDETVADNFLLAMEYVKASKAYKQKQMQAALEKVGLNRNILESPIYTLSGGEQQRVALARVYLKPNHIILADEPTGNLDLKNRDIIFNLLKNMAQEEDKIVVIVSHDPSVKEICDAVISLE